MALGFNLIYEIIFFLGWLLYFPRFIYHYFVTEKYKGNFFKRFYFGFPNIQKKNNQKVIWIHAVSVGETHAITQMAHVYKESNPSDLIIISNITETGHVQAKKSIPFADYHVFLPWDFFWNVSTILTKLKPDIILISETDIWYQFLSCSKRYGTKIAIVNAKISDRSVSKLKRFKWVAKKLYQHVDLIAAQNEMYKERFQAIGIPSEKIFVTGNLKSDTEMASMSEEEKEKLMRRLGIEKESFVLTVGSTHHPEEREILKVLKKLIEKFPKLKVLLVPRHPERFKEVEWVLSDLDIAYNIYSSSSNQNKMICLVDEMGILQKCYQVSNLAIVGGSFTPKVGGHNILEPCFCSTPVIFGPYLFNQKDFERLVLEIRSGIQVANYEQLADVLVELMTNQKTLEDIRKNGTKLKDLVSGTTRRTWDLIQNNFFE